MIILISVAPNAIERSAELVKLYVTLAASNPFDVSLKDVSALVFDKMSREGGYALSS